MEFRRRLSRVEADDAIRQMRRAWIGRSPRHLRAHERATFVTVARRVRDSNDRLSPTDGALALDASSIDDEISSDLAVGLIERGPRFTRATFLGIAPRSAVFEREGRSLIALAAFGEPREPSRFAIRAPRDADLLARLDLARVARRGVAKRGDVESIRCYLLVFCFYSDDSRYARIAASARDPRARAHLDELREACRAANLEIGPEMTRLREGLLREAGEF